MLHYLFRPGLVAFLFFNSLSVFPQDLPKGVPEVARDAIKASVLIIVSDKTGRDIRQGSGFVISRDGKIVTSYHVIEDANSAIVKFSNGAFYLVEGVLGVDPAKDVAVLKASGKDFPWLPVGNSDSVQVGEHVVAVGSPLAIEASISDGIISAVREITFRQGSLTVLQTTAPISSGSSGGALLNMKGEVIGVTAAQLTGGQNLNFAIPISSVVPLLLFSSTKPLAQYATTSTNATVSAPPTLPRDQQAPSAPIGKHPVAPWLDGDAPSAPVRWKIEIKNGELWATSQRLDKTCADLISEDLKNPSVNWYGCSLPAFITKVPMTIINAYILHVTIAPHFKDSERIDITVRVEQPDHTYRTYLKKDAPIVILGGVLAATAEFGIPYDTPSVPTVEAVEKGGKKEATHIYR